MKLINVFSFSRLIQIKPLNQIPFMLSKKKDKMPDKEKDKTIEKEKEKGNKKEKEGFPWE